MKNAVMLAVLLATAAPRWALPAEAPEERALHSSDVAIGGTQGETPITARVTYPDSSRAMPAIVLIPPGPLPPHSPLAQFWASRGYVVVEFAVSGAQGTGRSRGIWIWINPAEGRDAALAATRVIDSLHTIEKSAPGLAGKIDTQRIGVAGNSLGSYAAALLAGAIVQAPRQTQKRSRKRLQQPPPAEQPSEQPPPPPQQLPNLRDPRPIAFLLLSPLRQGQGGLGASSWNDIDRPMMTISEGIRRRRAFGRNEMDSFELSPGTNLYGVWITRNGPGSWNGRGVPRGYGPEGRGNFRSGGGDHVSEASLKAVEAVSLSFWNAYLKMDEGARKNLTSGKWPQPEGLELRISSK